jgi:cell division septum initiation protein DivIVA
MPSPIEEVIKRRVIQQWLSGEPRDKIASDLQIGAGTVSGIVSDFKENLHGSDLDSVRELAIEARKQGLTPSDLAAHIRLHNFFIKSGAAEDKVESFIANVNSNDIPPERVIELVYQLHGISKSESIPLDQVANYVKEKLEEKQKIDEEIKEADAILQSKNVSIDAINEHIKLNEEFNKHGQSTHDIPRLLGLLKNAKRYGFDGKEIADKLYNIQELEWKEKQLKDKCKKLSKRISKYKDVVPLTEDIAAWGIGIDELLALKVGINQAAKHYNLPPLAATLRLIDDIKKYNKINGLREELSALYLQKYTLDQACSRQSQSLIALAKLKSYGLTEDRILQLNNFLEGSVKY